MGIGVSVFLLAVGAILAFAVHLPADGINLDTIGVILIILGLVGLLTSLVLWDDWTPRRRLLDYADGDAIIPRRRPRVVDLNDGVVDVAEDRPVVDVVEERPVVERRRVTTRRTTYDGF